MSAVDTILLTEAHTKTIACQEGAGPEDVQEALRRMRQNPRLQSGQVRSQGAFFRGILRGVLADKVLDRAGPPAVPEKPLMKSPSRCHRARKPAALGGLHLRAYSLLGDGVDETGATALLQQEFQVATPTQIAQALQWAKAIRETLSP